jgi:hypothetical protein
MSSPSPACVRAAGGSRRAGVIDILQEYTAKKAGESLLKSMFHSKKAISAVEPHAYARRFVEFIDAHTM